ncbi:MAG: hypothetical protein HY470_00515, partial [Candidatus Ryanbacteria bacterium]|nr:hypothetical protein [Candidatus Ryanbacteria bacterium]
MKPTFKLSFFLALLTTPLFSHAAYIDAGGPYVFYTEQAAELRLFGSTDHDVAGTYWEKVSGSGDVEFFPSQGSKSPSVSFSAPGIYTVQYCAVLTACDSATIRYQDLNLSSSSDVVQLAPGESKAVTITARPSPAPLDVFFGAVIP